MQTINKYVKFYYIIIILILKSLSLICNYVKFKSLIMYIDNIKAFRNFNSELYLLKKCAFESRNKIRSLGYFDNA